MASRSEGGVGLRGCAVSVGSHDGKERSGIGFLRAIHRDFKIKFARGEIWLSRCGITSCEVIEIGARTEISFFFF